MEEYEELLTEIRREANNLREFLEGMKATSLKPPMPTSVRYTTPKFHQTALDNLEKLVRATINLEDEIEVILEEASVKEEDEV